MLIELQKDFPVKSIGTKTYLTEADRKLVEYPFIANCTRRSYDFLDE